MKLDVRIHIEANNKKSNNLKWVIILILLCILIISCTDLNQIYIDMLQLIKCILAS